MIHRCKILFLLLIPASAFANKTWEQLLAEYDAHMSNDDKKLLLRQHAAFAAGRSPIIAAPEIKSIAIADTGEPIIDVRKYSVARLGILPDSPEQIPFSAPYYNSGLANASKMRSAIFARLVTMVTHLDDLSQPFGYQPGQVAIKLFEGLRDLKTQEQLFNKKVQEILTQNISLTQEEAEKEASKWVSPIKNNVPVHATGAAVDIRLWDTKNQEFLDMGIFGVIWGANPGAPTFSESITDTQKKNRLYCLLAARRAGLVNYSYEFWHYSAGDRYAAYWQEQDAAKRCTLYGPVAE
jgi:zinc D-Ala-D-Ala dipeptidase